MHCSEQNMIDRSSLKMMSIIDPTLLHSLHFKPTVLGLPWRRHSRLVHSSSLHARSLSQVRLASLIPTRQPATFFSRCVGPLVCVSACKSNSTLCTVQFNSLLYAAPRHIERASASASASSLHRTRPGPRTPLATRTVLAGITPLIPRRRTSAHLPVLTDRPRHIHDRARAHRPHHTRLHGHSSLRGLSLLHAHPLVVLLDLLVRHHPLTVLCSGESGVVGRVGAGVDGTHGRVESSLIVRLRTFLSLSGCRGRGLLLPGGELLGSEALDLIVCCLRKLFAILGLHLGQHWDVAARKCLA